MKMKRNIRKLSVLFIFIGCLLSCEYHVEEDLTIIEIPDDPCATITFSQHVKPIIDGRCVQCHSGNRFPDLRTFEGIKNSAGLIKSEVASRSMPQGSTLTEAQIQAVVCWVDGGALNN